jgi:hypothetical protein
MDPGMSSARARTFVALISAGLMLLVVAPSSAQMRMGMKEKIVNDIANEMVTTIQSESCADFEAMLKRRKGGSSSKRSGMLKQDPAARARFVNKVAGPLVNKMIDCDLLPGR